MEPIPESAELLRELSDIYGADLLEDLLRQAEAVREIVPELVGLSIAALKGGVAFTLVATDADMAVLDAIQYVVGGPCVDGPPAERVMHYDAEEPLDEGRWQTFAKATAAKAVVSTLTLPILDDAKVVGTVNLYAAVSGAFRGLHRELAAILAAWAPGAVTNADLSFHTRRTAEDALLSHHGLMRLEVAVGLLMSERGVDAETARAALAEAAERAGVSIDQLATAMLEAFEEPYKD